MAQPYDFPERLLAGKEEYYIRLKLGSQGMGKGGFTEDAIKEYVRCCTPENIHGVCEDYRAGATIDFEMDTKDLEAGNKITCPVLVIVGGQSHTAKLYGYEKGWATYVTHLVRLHRAAVRPLPRRAGPGRNLREPPWLLLALSQHGSAAPRSRTTGDSFMTANPQHAGELHGVIAQLRLVEYQPGSVVSRTLIKKSAGTVTAFAFDAGEALSEHTAPYDALILGVDGKAEVSIAGVAHNVSAGELLRLPAGQPHALKAIMPFKMILVMIRA